MDQNLLFFKASSNLDFVTSPKRLLTLEWLDGSVGWMSGSSVWLRSWLQDCGIEPRTRFHAQHGTCLTSSLSHSLSLSSCSCFLSLLKNNWLCLQWVKDSTHNTAAEIWYHTALFWKKSLKILRWVFYYNSHYRKIFLSSNKSPEVPFMYCCSFEEWKEAGSSWKCEF